MYVTPFFDVEDIHCPETDEAAKVIADIFWEESVRATFNVTGDKARILTERDREDVITSLTRHDIGFHSNTHSRHPTISEYLENSGWTDGVDKVIQEERPGIAAVRSVFGQEPSCFMRPGATFAAQAIHAGGKQGLPFVGSAVAHPRENVFWYTNTLHFTDVFGMSDQDYAATDRFEEQLFEFDDFLEDAIRKDRAWVGVFCGHPVTIRANEFGDVLNFAEGRMPPEEEWTRPTLKSAAAWDLAKENLRRLAVFLREKDGVTVEPIDRSRRRFDDRPSQVDRADILDAANRAADDGIVPVTDSLSPAETLLGFAEFVQSYARNGVVPDRVTRRSILGPTVEPPTAPGSDVVYWDGLVDAADQLLAASGAGSLPARVEAGDVDIGIGRIYVALAVAIEGIRNEAPPPNIDLPDEPRYPAIEQDLEETIPSWLTSWEIHHPNLDPTALVTHARLQTWTMAPADTG